VKGAFTGADRAKEGLLASAEGGTVFLDEIGELPLDLQAKLLRALQEKEVRPVGSTVVRPISARVLAATNRDLAGMVERGSFRKDLYFRLNVVNLRIPPLRNRREDIAPLAVHFLEQMEKESGVVRTFSDSTLRVMTEFDWPGNVRELENAIERAVVIAPSDEISRECLRPEIADPSSARSAARGDSGAGAIDISRGINFYDEVRRFEIDLIRRALDQTGGHQSRAARLLGMNPTTLNSKIKTYNINLRP
jgi:two-component system response regulator HydG